MSNEIPLTGKRPYERSAVVRGSTSYVSRGIFWLEAWPAVGAVGFWRIYFGCRDGACYAADCIDGHDGHVVWKVELGSPVTTTPALRDGKVYVVASGGVVACLNALDGRRHWTFDVAGHAGFPAKLYSSPAVIAAPDAGGNRICFGAELESRAANPPSYTFFVID